MRNFDDQIRKAMEEGQFDNLPGKGKPLHLDENIHEDPAWRLAYHVLRNAGYSLPWIQERAEILAALEEYRQTLKKTWAWKVVAAKKNFSHSEVEAEWQRAAAVFRKQIAELDLRIRDFNLEVAHVQFQLARLKIEKEIAAICGEDSSGAG